MSKENTSKEIIVKMGYLLNQSDLNPPEALLNFLNMPTKHPWISVDLKNMRDAIDSLYGIFFEKKEMILEKYSKLSIWIDNEGEEQETYMIVEDGKPTNRYNLEDEKAAVAEVNALLSEEIKVDAKKISLMMLRNEDFSNINIDYIMPFIEDDRSK